MNSNLISPVFSDVAVGEGTVVLNEWFLAQTKVPVRQMEILSTKQNKSQKSSIDMVSWCSVIS